ncbi:MAG: hypothetical protein ABSB22_10870 [Thermodesulfobacteriota bacterium]|jgi:DNA-binding phage protein
MTGEKPSIESILRGLVKERSLKKVAHDLGIDHASLYRSLKDGSNLKLNRIEAILNYFGYELNISKRKEVKRTRSSQKVLKEGK